MVGIGLLATVTIVAWWLARLAHRGVRRYRAEHHEDFIGRPPA